MAAELLQFRIQAMFRNFACKTLAYLFLLQIFVNR